MWQQRTQSFKINEILRLEILNIIKICLELFFDLIIIIPRRLVQKTLDFYPIFSVLWYFIKDYVTIRSHHPKSD